MKSKKMKLSKGYTLGIILVCVGVFLLLKALGVITFSIWKGFATYWPIGLILAGVAFIIKRRGLGIFLILLTLIFGAVYAADKIEVGESRESQQTINFDSDITSVDFSIDYGAGQVFISGNDIDNLLVNQFSTSDFDDPKLSYNKKESQAEVVLSRHGGGSFFGKHQDQWNITLKEDLVYFMHLEYGAAEMNLDISKLDVSELEIETGASSTLIRFGYYPTKVKLGTGASNVKLEFPAGSSVKVDVESGLSSINLASFKKEGNVYTSPDYNEKEFIFIEIQAGAATINGEFY